MTKRLLVLGLTAVLMAAIAVPALANGKGAVRADEHIWANDMIWDTILTPATFKHAPEHSVDLLYDFSSELSGQRPVADAWPGSKDPKYNGGRWWVQKIEFTELGMSIHDSNDDGIADFELTSAEEVLLHASLGHFTIEPTNIYFECPLLKSR